MTHTKKTLEKALSNLASEMAYQACNTKDIQTTGEGKSMLRHTYQVAYSALETVVESYLKRI